MRKLTLANYQSPGDVVMLTAAVRDLHRLHPGQFVTDIRTLHPELWENNPFITAIHDDDESAEQILCHYPLIQRSNSEPWHFIHGFSQFLGERLNIRMKPTRFKGDIHLNEHEKSAQSQVAIELGKDVPFWIVSAGGKRDFTIKWWSTRRFQEVVDHFRGEILFVQVGAKTDVHPPLKGVLDLRQKTSLRQLVNLVYHAQGVLCPVTLLMHLAAAVETQNGLPTNRACVVVGGGREPSQWETYPHHQFLHTNGLLKCCDTGGCWRARTFPLLDADANDLPANLCVDVVPENWGTKELTTNLSSVGSNGYPHDAWSNLIPRCMGMITPNDVIRRIELFFETGRINYLPLDIRRSSLPDR